MEEELLKLNPKSMPRNGEEVTDLIDKEGKRLEITLEQIEKAKAKTTEEMREALNLQKVELNRQVKELATIKQQLLKEREEQGAKNQQWQEKLNQQELTHWKDMTAGHQSGIESIRTLYSQQRPPPAPQQQNPYQQHNLGHQQSQLYNDFNYSETRYNTMRMPEYNDYGCDHSKKEDDKPLKIFPKHPRIWESNNRHRRLDLHV